MAVPQVSKGKVGLARWTMPPFAAMISSALFLAVPCPAAEIVKISVPLDERPLYLRPGDHLELPFNAHRALIDIVDVRLRVTGSYSNDRSVCWEFGNFGAGTWTYDGPAGLGVSILDLDARVCETSHVFPPVGENGTAFDFELSFDCGAEEPDWSFLSPGMGTIHLTGLDCEHSPVYPEICICGHSAELGSVALIVRLGSGVAASRSSWGMLKALYR
jgi:hypothetical protein